MRIGDEATLNDVYHALDLAYTKETGGAMIGQRVGYQLAQAAISATLEGLADDADAVHIVAQAFLRSLAAQRKAMAVATIMPETALVAARAAIIALCGDAPDDDWLWSSADEFVELWPGGPRAQFHDPFGNPVALEFRVIDQRIEFREPAQRQIGAPTSTFFVGDRALQPGEYSREPAVYGDKRAGREVKPLRYDKGGDDDGGSQRSIDPPTEASPRSAGHGD